MKKLWLLLVLVSFCMLPLCAAAISDEVHMDVGQHLFEEYEGEGSDMANADNDIKSDIGSGAQDESWFAAEEAEKAAAKLYTEDILTTGGVVKDIRSLKFEEMDEVFFREMQIEFLTYVQKVNWETHLRLTPRDSSWLMRMCRYVCEGINYVYRLSSSKDANLVANKIGKSIENVSRKRTCNSIMCLTIEEMVSKVEVENPFILLAVDLATFKEVIRMEPKVAQLYRNMFMFFKARATMERGDYIENTEELLRLAGLGKGSHFETWEELAKFAVRSKELDSKGLLNPKTELVAQMKMLEISMLRIEDQVKMKREVAKLLRKNPVNRTAATKLQLRVPQRPTYKQRARTYIRNKKFTPKIAAKWIIKYHIK